MTETAFKLLLVEDNRKLADLVCDACKRDSSSPVYDIIVFARVDEVLVAGDGAGFDLILVGIGLAGTDSIEATETLSARYPGTPIMVLTPENDPAFAVNAIDAGARDCLGGDEIGSPLLQRMARHIIERNRIQRRADKLRTRQDGESEMLQLKTLCSPGDLRTTRKSLDTRQLMDARPKEFSVEIQKYGSLLDRLLNASGADEKEVIKEELHGLADRLGSLNTGPRDLVEIHKAALAEKLQSPFATDTAASIEEGRLLLLQLMGHLVSYYRRLSWGRRIPDIARQNINMREALARREKD